ncbi:shikimate dehydrogenase [Lysinibacter cavernae]|uniref:Shikimate dehydrogenase n=1 Tax=Lysinibacter cavernae TaxID=1640652 RepID=A0A7X5TS91_9MICO|nr:shikimate dehydrogenase [Lysinibacter cavernae]NIH52705.1 shikimate dehydrogenase [Lysinibacter cavernae]
MTDSATSFGVLGSPIGHSLSPVIHSAAYRELGLDWSYDAIDCVEDALPAQLASLNWHGISLTMPLKHGAYAAASWHDPVAVSSGVANTLLRVVDGAGDESWRAYNTDVAGLVAALGEVVPSGIRAIALLGGGATAVSTVLAAAAMGTTIVRVHARNTEKAAPLIALGKQHGVLVTVVSLHDDSSWNDGEVPIDVVVSTVPGHLAGELSVPSRIRSAVPLYDVAYDPWPSPLARLWAEAAGTYASGISMLLHQAIVQIRIFMAGDPNRPLPEEDKVLAAMRDAVADRNLG